MTLALVLGLALTSQAQTTWRDSVVTALNRQLSLYPQSMLRDIYKNFFQGVFGPGHIISDRQSATRYLVNELEQTDSTPMVTMFEPTGVGARYYRVDLAAIKSGMITTEQMIDALVRSAAKPAAMTVKQWAEEWRRIETIVKELHPGITDFDTDSKTIARLLAEGKYVMHHSRHFNELYHPHYRLIEADIFNKELLPKLRHSPASPSSPSQ